MARFEKDELLEEKRMMIRLEAAGYRDYNKTLLLISAGAFVLSFFLLDKMSNPNYLLFLVYTWLFWTIALLMQLGALSMYPKAIREELSAMHGEPKEKGTNRFNQPYFVMSKMGLLSTISLGLGIFFFIVFVLYNLNCF